MIIKSTTSLVMAFATLAAVSAEAASCAASSNATETVFELVSSPLPILRTETGYVRVAGRVKCDAGSIVLKLAGPGAADSPALTVVFTPGAIALARDGEAPENVLGGMGNGAFDFRLCVHNIGQNIRTCRLQTRVGNEAEFGTVAQVDWPSPRFAEQEPMAWLSSGAAMAGLAGTCRIEGFRVEYVVPGSLFMVR